MRRTVALWMAVSICACGGDTTDPPPPDPPRAATLTVTPETAELTALGATLQLTAQVHDQYGGVMPGASVMWSSSDASIATVDAGGLVTAAGNGAATVTARSGEAAATVEIAVEQLPAEVLMDPTNDTLVAFGDTLRLSAAALDANGNAVAAATFTWSSGDTLVATVDQDGLVTGVAAGEAEITATSAEAVGRAQLTITEPVPTTVAVSPDTVAFSALGQTARLAAEVRDQVGRVMDGEPVSWSSSDTLVARVDSAGLVTAMGTGATTVAATSGSATAAAVVTVTQSAGSVVVSPPAATMALGDTLRLGASAFDENGRAVADAEFDWSSSDLSVLRVDGSGLVTGVGEGRATVAAVADGARGAAEITVENPDRAALVALYEATDGPNWVNSDHWLTDAPLDDWHGVDTDASGRVVRLILSGGWDGERNERATHGLAGPIPSALARLTALRDLNLEDNRLAGPIPSELGELSNLHYLMLANNRLEGPIPAALADPPNLEVLRLGNNQLTGSIPAELGDLRRLRHLWIGGNPLTGRIPAALGKLGNLEQLGLAHSTLEGPIPPELGQLARVKSLGLSYNNLTGPIPAALGNLSSVEELWLDHNQFHGPVPQGLLRLEGLRVLRIGGNSGLCVPGTSHFVAWLRGIEERDDASEGQCNAADVTVLASLHEATRGDEWHESSGWLGDGALEEWYGVTADSLGRVVALDLAGNALTGQLPGTLGELALMTELRLNGNAGLSGHLPVTLARLSLQALHYGGTGLCVPASAPFRRWLNGLPSHEGTGAECALLPEREVLSHLYHATDGPSWRNKRNWLTDAPLGDWHGVEVDGEGRVARIELVQNNLSGPIPPELGDLAHLASLVLGNNALAGSIPPEFGNLAELKRLDLGFNNLAGSIPPELGSLAGLTHLDLRHNSLSGSIPRELGKLSELDFLVLNYNRLTGPIPPELGRLASLRVMAMSGNRLSGSIPRELGGLANLTDLALVGNKNLTGPIPRELGGLESLRFIYLADNSLSGPIPAEFAGLANLIELELRNNELSGPIPPGLGGLSHLRHLDFAYNGLTGRIPPELGGLSALERLRLGHNRLEGSVPARFAELARLRELSLVNNSGLSGALPGGLTALGGLESLVATGTGLCAPSDASFTEWLEGVPRRRVARCDRDPEMAYLVQAVQSREFPVPLVAGRRALLRAFVTATRETGAGIPPVRARFYRNGGEIYVADIPGKETPIPTEVVEGDLKVSANIEIPGDIVQPGLEMVIEVDPDGTLGAGLLKARRIPETGRMTLDVRAMPPFNLTVVPLLWRANPDSSVLERTRGMTAAHDLFWLTRTLLPIGDFNLEVHEPVLISSSTTGSIIREVERIWAVEGRKGHYVGLITGLVDGKPAGQWFGAGQGSAATRRVTFLQLGTGRGMAQGDAHEFGHNMSLLHTLPSARVAPTPHTLTPTDRSVPGATTSGTGGYLSNPPGQM